MERLVTKNFNIHNVLKFRISWTRYCALLKDLDLKFSYFQVKRLEEDDIDLDIKVGAFSPSLDGKCRKYERNIFIHENFIYCKGSNLRSTWEFQISDISGKRTKFNINIRSRTLRGFLAPNFPVHNLALPLMEIKTLEKGYLLLHSAAVSKDGNACLIAGRGGSFKTTMVMNLMRDYGYQYMGDDRVLVTTGKVLSFPTHIKIFEFCLRNLKTEKMTLTKKLLLTFYLLATSSNTNVKIADESRLCGLIFLNPSKETRLDIIDWRLAAEKMLSNQLMEYFEASNAAGFMIHPLFECFNIYASAYPDTKIAKFQDFFIQQFKKIFSNIKIYNFFIPFSYTPKITELIRKVMEEIGV